MLGAITLSVSIDGLRTKATATAAVMAGFAFFAFIFLRRTPRGPIASTAASVEEVVERALHGDFKTRITQSTHDEIGPDRCRDEPSADLSGQWSQPHQYQCRAPWCRAGIN